MNKKINLIYWYLFLIIFLEIIYKIFVWKTLLDLKLIVILFFSIPFSFVFYYISKIGKGLFNKFITIIISFFVTLIFAAQYIYYEFYKSIFSIFSVFMGTKQVFGEFGGAVFDYIIRYWYVLLIMFLPFVLFIIKGTKIFNFDRIRLKEFLKTLFVFITFYICNFIYLKIMNNEIYSENRIYFKVHSPMLTINKLGLMTMEKLDIKRYIFGFKDEIYDIEENSNIINNIEEISEYNISNINFDKLIKNESDETIKTMHLYFKNAEASNKNKYTGIFKNKNLIFVTAESLDISAIREDISPTLHMMMNKGYVFKNFYQPLYPVSTSDGEYMALNSLLPKESTWSFYDSSKNFMPYGIGNIFKNNGYSAYGYHNHTYDYYNRNLSHTNIGLNYIGCGNGMEQKINCELWPESDLEMFESTIDDYINEDKFMAYYMTVSGHLRYNMDNSMVQKNIDKVQNLSYSETAKSYLASNVELEKAMFELIAYLKSKGKYNDTVIVIVPDHYPYGLSIDELNEISEIDRKDKFELYHTSLIIFNPNIEKEIIETKISSLDILPTIYNLFGVEFDSRLLMGRDIFSDTEKTVILSDRSWMTDRGKYDAITDVFIPFDQHVDDSYVDKMNIKVYQKFTMSSYILDNNYYDKLGIKND